MTIRAYSELAHSGAKKRVSCEVKFTAELLS